MPHRLLLVARTWAVTLIEHVWALTGAFSSGSSRACLFPGEWEQRSVVPGCSSPFLPTSEVTVATGGACSVMLRSNQPCLYGFWNDDCCLSLSPIAHIRATTLCLAPTPPFRQLKKHLVSPNPCKCSLANHSLPQSYPTLWDSICVLGKHFLWWFTPPPFAIPNRGALILLRVQTSSQAPSAVVFDSPAHGALLSDTSRCLHTTNLVLSLELTFRSWVSEHTHPTWPSQAVVFGVVVQMICVDLTMFALLSTAVVLCSGTMRSLYFGWFPSWLGDLQVWVPFLILNSLSGILFLSSFPFSIFFLNLFYPNFQGVLAFVEV